MASLLERYEEFVRMRVDKSPSIRKDLPIVDKKDEFVEQVQNSDYQITNQLNDFRTLAEDRQSQYDAYDEMSNDPIIAAALEIYADDATAYDEQGRIIWVESDDDKIAAAGNRLLDIMEIPERAWKHIYLACKYGDYYLKLYRKNDPESEDIIDQSQMTATVRVVNDVRQDNLIYPYDEYVEDVPDPSTIFDLRKKGKTSGFIEVTRDQLNKSLISSRLTQTYSLQEVKVYKPDRLIHIVVGDNLTRYPEEVVINTGDGKSSIYQVSRGKSILQDVYPVQKELQLLEDSLLLNRLTRSSLIRLLEIEVGDMPKKEINDYLRRIKQLIEQHISMDKTTGQYKSYNSPGPIDNVIYIPVKNGKGSVSINNLGGDVNIRDIADIDYFNNKRSGALKIPRAYLGDDMDGSGLSNGGSLTKLSARYARTIKRIQTSYIRSITNLLNLFFVDKKLDYVNKFTVRMTSPSTQEDLERNELIQGNIDLIDSIMSLAESLEGGTQKKILTKLVNDVLKMPEIGKLIEEDLTPDEDVSVDGEMHDAGDLDMSSDFDSGFETSSDSGPESSEGPADVSDEDSFTDDEFSSFEDEL